MSEEIRPYGDMNFKELFKVVENIHIPANFLIICTNGETKNIIDLFKEISRLKAALKVAREALEHHAYCDDECHARFEALALIDGAEGKGG